MTEHWLRRYGRNYRLKTIRNPEYIYIPSTSIPNTITRTISSRISTSKRNMDEGVFYL